MGIPSFYKYISERYPLINQTVNMGLRPEFDCLYLDMNGIVHNATHANSTAADNLTEDEMFLRIFQYIDKLFKLVQPQKLIYMALDGVAPRAKMNQQRQRRFKSALDAQVTREEGLQNGSLREDDEAFDRNCITPGTVFMDKLSAHIQYYIRRKIHEDPQWQQIQVIFSGSDSIGEGEHKIMSYLRSQRMQPNYDPNLRHCLYGLDADLLMLSLLSHEHNICLLREEVVFGPPKDTRKQLVKPGEFQLLHVGLLREYLHMDLQFDTPWYNLDRMIDDIVLICYLVGNDFLPSIPTIRIPLGGLDVLFRVYRESIIELGDYITCYGAIDLDRLIKFFAGLAQEEPAILDMLNKQRQKLRETRGDNTTPLWALADNDVSENPEALAAQHAMVSSQIDLTKVKTITEGGVEKEDIVLLTTHDIQATAAQQSEEILQYFTKTNSNSNPESSTVATTTPGGSNSQPEGQIIDLDSIFNSSDDDDDDDSNAVNSGADDPKTTDKSQLFIMDDIFGDDGSDLEDIMHMLNGDLTYENYYLLKMPNIDNTREGINQACMEYIEGLFWVYRYYYQGVPSWRWNFRHLYSPLLVDLAKVDASKCKFQFDIDEPFTPLQQLMGVLPPQSAALLPAGLRPLMLNSTSDIKDFYPETFEVDMDGKRNDWEGIPLIPFIDENRLVNAMGDIPHDQLSDDDHRRNINSDGDMLFQYDRKLQTQAYKLTDGYLTMIQLCHPELISKVSTNQPYNRRLFPDMTSCHVSVQLYILPQISIPPAHLFETKGSDDVDSLLHTISPALDGSVIQQEYQRAEQLDRKYLCGKILDVPRYLPIHLPKSIQPLPGFPTLAPINYTSKLDFANISIFGRPSFRRSMVVEFNEDPHPVVYTRQYALLDRDGLNTRSHPFPHALSKPYTVDDLNDLNLIAQRFPPRRIIWCDYPYFRPGRVEYLTDGVRTLVTNGAGGFSVRDSSPSERKFYGRHAPVVMERSTKMLGLSLPKSKVMVMVSPLIGMTRSPVGGIIPRFDDDVESNTKRKDLMPVPGPFFAHPFTLFAVPPVHREQRWVASYAIKQLGSHKPGDEIIFIGGEHYGCIGVVESKGSKADEYNIRLTQAPPCPLNTMQELADTSKLVFFPSYKLARALGIPGSTLGRITGEIWMNLGRRERMNIGLSLRFADRGLVVPDYVRLVPAWNMDAQGHERSMGEQWEYSTLTTVLINAYRKAFPEIFKYMNDNPHEYRLHVNDICPPNVSSEAYAAKLKNFMSSLNLDSLVAVPTTSKQLPLATVRRLESFIYKQYDLGNKDTAPTSTPTTAATPETGDILDKYTPHNVLDTVKSHQINLSLTNVPSGHLLQHTPAVPYSPTTGFNLCDRVMIIRKDAGLLGATGTVVGVHSTFLEILLDELWISATTLRNKCRYNLGIITDMTSVLNLSQPHVDVIRYDYATYRSTGKMVIDRSYQPHDYQARNVNTFIHHQQQQRQQQRQQHRQPNHDDNNNQQKTRYHKNTSNSNDYQPTHPSKNNHHNSNVLTSTHQTQPQPSNTNHQNKKQQPRQQQSQSGPQNRPTIMKTQPVPPPPPPQPIPQTTAKVVAPTVVSAQTVPVTSQQPPPPQPIPQTTVKVVAPRVVSAQTVPATSQSLIPQPTTESTTELNNMLDKFSF